MKKNSNQIAIWKVSLITIGAAIILWGVFALAGYIGGLGYVSIGDSYEKAGFVPAKYASFNVTFKNAYSGTLTLIDKSGKQLSNSDYNVKVNGKKKGTSFSVQNEKMVRISICGKSVKARGRNYVRVKGGGPYISHYYFRHHSNPFIVWIWWICLTLIFITIIWFTVLQRLLYPRFRAIKKTLLIPNQSPIVIRMKGVRLVVIDNTTHKQSWWNSLWTGKVIYKQHPSIVSPIILKPTDKGRKILVALNPMDYTCTPNPIDMRPAIIEDRINKKQIQIN